jgi:acetolactate synthase I/III small subunit
MPASFPEAQNEQSHGSRFTMLELTVNNHAGVMSQVCGLLTRRGWGVEGMFSLPGALPAQRRIWLLVSAEQPLDQMIKHVSKLQDVLHLRSRGAERDVFGQLEQIISSCSRDQRGVQPL